MARRHAIIGLVGVGIALVVLGLVVGVPGLDGAELAQCFSGDTAVCGEPSPGLPGARDGNLWAGTGLAALALAAAAAGVSRRAFAALAAVSLVAIIIALILGPPDASAVQGAYSKGLNAEDVVCEVSECLDPPRLFDPGDANLWLAFGALALLPAGLCAARLAPARRSA